jgi:protein involved in polysaccharide export with SLBB domain
MGLFGEKKLDDFWKASPTAEEDPRIRPGLVLRVGATAGGLVIAQETAKEVDINGDIHMTMLVETVKCEGLTVVELQEKITEAYKALYVNPQATVAFYWDPKMETPSPWGTVIVQGSVLRPGQVNIPPTRDLTLTRALMFSGNILPLGDKTNVRVSRRDQEGKLKKLTVNIERIAKGEVEWDITLRAGDVVWVPETMF